MLRSILAIIIFAMSAATTGGDIVLTGRIVGDVAGGTVIVRAYDLPGGRTTLSKDEFYGGLAPAAEVTAKPDGAFAISGVTAGRYAIIAFADLNGDGAFGFDPPEPLGWYMSEPGGYSGSAPVREKTDFGDIVLRRATPFPAQAETDHGRLTRIKWIPVLHLHGTAEERGYAHGFLIGRQIIDFFEFYQLEEQWRSPRQYQEVFVPFIENNFAVPEAMAREVDAVIAGMKAAGTPMRIEALGRDFYRTDLIAINAYIERRAAFPVANPSSCTQFAAWGARTRGGELDGALIAGRNMDGECDARKVTVSHFLVFAVDPAEAGSKRFISAMWPGFVGTITGFNEDGLYSMENAGGSAPGPVVTGGIVPCAWTQRLALEKLDGTATPAEIENLMAPLRNRAGGVTAPGSIILWAMPFTGQDAPAFVWEGDRAGGVHRLPGEAAPQVPHMIMASNHHLKYGHDPARPDLSFGLPAGFSSLWRYEAGSNLIEAWARAGRAIGIAEMQRLLQTVAHGTTEHALIVIPQQKRVFIAVDDLKADLWDAPFQRWAEFRFEEFFAQ